MGDLIKIVGVQYAVNSNHVKGEDMTAQEQQKTIEFLTMLDRKHPYVSVKPEPTNETDEEAFVARFASRKAGYVRNREEYKSLAQAALTTSGRGYFRARVKEVIISAEGYFFVEAETDSTPIVPILHKDHWKEWEPLLPLFPMTEEFLCVEDATMMMIDRTYNKDFLEKLDGYLLRLDNCKGSFVVKQLNKIADKLAEEMARLADLADDDTLWELSHRSIFSAWKKGAVLWILNDQSWSKSIGDFVEWFCYYDLWSKVKVFGDMFKAGDGQEEAQRSGPKNMLDQLENSFNELQLETLRLSLGKNQEGTKHQLNVWKNRQFITEPTLKRSIF